MANSERDGAIAGILARLPPSVANTPTCKALAAQAIDALLALAAAAGSFNDGRIESVDRLIAAATAYRDALLAVQTGAADVMREMNVDGPVQ